MHLVFERPQGRFRSNCNILALAWMPYYRETKFRQALFEYHQKLLINSNSSFNALQSSNDTNRNRSSSRDQEANQSGEQPEQCGDSDRATTSSQSNKFLNSRVSELHQRYLFSRDSRRSKLDEKKITRGSSISSELDKKYGRIPDFGWLVIGNVGKVIGITLTSVIPPPVEKSAKALHSGGHHKDLIIFNEDEVKDQNKSKQQDSKADFERIRPDRPSLRSNYNLRGHLDEIILVKWNELYQKLATVDSKGNVFIWCKVNEKFTVQTPFYNHTKSVADFKWSNDGKTALICYTDSFILVGSSSGQRHWHSMLNLDDYHITCASWTPNDEQVLLGVSNGNMVIIDLPQSELTELVVNQTTIRAMSWSTCKISMKDVENISIASTTTQDSISRQNSTIVNHRRLSRDCSVFSRYRFCSQGPNSTQMNAHPSSQSTPSTVAFNMATQNYSKQSNILAIDFSNNTIKLYDGGLQDSDPRTIQVNLESYLMQWSSDGKLLAVAGFNIHTTAPSVGCLKCRYSNAIKFFNQQGKLVYERILGYTRYPITAFTWAHDDTRIFVATGPKLHCAKVMNGICPLTLLSASTIQKYTRLPDKSDILEGVVSNRYNPRVLNWQSYNCPLDVSKESKRFRNIEHKCLMESKSSDSSDITNDSSQQSDLFCNNSNVYLYKLPPKLQKNIDDLFFQTTRQPFDEQWSLKDIIWHVPHNEQRYYCTLVCYTSEAELGTSGYQYRTQPMNKLVDNNTSDQNKIFILYVEFEGSLIPILRARQVGFLKPEFVIFDPEESTVKQQRQLKVSDVSQQMTLNQFAQRQINDLSRLAFNQNSLIQAENFGENCSDLHYLEPRASCSSIGKQSLSDAEHYYSFESDTMNRQNQARITELINGRSYHQEPISLPTSTNDPYLLYMTSTQQFKQYIAEESTKKLTTNSDTRNLKKNRVKYRTRNTASGDLYESNELVRIKSNIWGTAFKMINMGNRAIKQRSILGCVVYKASLLHLQPRQIFLNVKDMSNYCCLCSKHHHTNANYSKQTQVSGNVDDSAKNLSLLDIPNNELNGFPIKSSSFRHKVTKSKENNILMPVGDGIRIAPKLERNQQYRFAGSLTIEEQRPSTSRSSGGTKSPSRSLSSSKKHKLRNGGRPTSKENYSGSSSSATHARGNYSFNRANSFSSDRNSVNQVQIDQPDDVLTLSISSNNQMEVELSCRNGNGISNSNSLRKSPTNSSKVNEFLAMNKTLKSIQTITQMIVDMSTKANEIEPTSSLNVQNLTSPSKSATDECRTSSAMFVPPDTPVHRPNRRALGRPEGRNYPVNYSQSANTTPSKELDNARRRSRRRFEDKDKSATPLMSPLPLPPPNVPIGRRLSISAKRFFDGSLRSLYGSGAISSELDSEDCEPLVSGRHRFHPNAHITSSKRKSDELNKHGHSQPSSPMRSFDRRSSNDLTSFKSKLLGKFGTNDKKALASTASTSSSRLDQIGAVLRHGTKEASASIKSSQNLLSMSSAIKNVVSLGNNLSNSSDDDATSFEYSDLEFEDDGLVLSSTKKKFSFSARDLSDLSSKLTNRQKSGRPLEGRKNKSKRGRQRKRQRKSICSNANCCCAKEFKLSNRPPVWNEMSQVYQLDFGGRVTQESAKNLQIDFEGKLALQFGRIDKCTYTLDYKYPFNAVQAMAVALASLTQRLK